MDQVAGKRGFMSEDMRPVFETQFAGRAVTAQLRPLGNAEKATDQQLNLAAIDEAGAGSVLVIVVQGDKGIAGIGGLMSNACKARGLHAAVIDGWRAGY